MPLPGDFFGPAIVTPLWILLGAVFGIHGLWVSPMTRARGWGLGAYSLAAVVLAFISRWYGATQIQIARMAEKARTETETKASTVQNDLRDELKRANEGLSETQQQLRQMQLSVDRLSLTRPTGPPSNLSGLDRERLVATLSPFRGEVAHTNIAAALGDARAILYAQQWMELLSESKWPVDGVDQAIWTPPLVGIQIVVKSG